MRKIRMSIGIILIAATICCALSVVPLYADPDPIQGQGTSGPQSPNPAPRQDPPAWVWALI